MSGNGYHQASRNKNKQKKNKQGKGSSTFVIEEPGNNHNAVKEKDKSLVLNRTSSNDFSKNTSSVHESYIPSTNQTQSKVEPKTCDEKSVPDLSPMKHVDSSESINSFKSDLLNTLLKEKDMAKFETRMKNRIKCCNCGKPNILLQTDLTEMATYIQEILKENKTFKTVANVTPEQVVDVNDHLHSAMINSVEGQDKTYLELNHETASENVMDTECIAAAAATEDMEVDNTEGAVCNSSNQEMEKNHTSDQSRWDDWTVTDNYTENASTAARNQDSTFMDGSNSDNTDNPPWQQPNRNRSHHNDGGKRNTAVSGDDYHRFGRGKDGRQFSSSSGMSGSSDGPWRQDNRNRRFQNDYENKDNNTRTSSSHYGNRDGSGRRENSRQDEQFCTSKDKRNRFDDASGRWENSRQDNQFPTRKGGKPEKTYKIVEETFGDLFTAPDDHCLAHCVAEDMRMGSGIAVQFRSQFKRVDELLAQRRRSGQLAFLKVEGRYIYYLVTKKQSTGKPRHRDLESSLEEMKKHCVENEVKKIAMPRIGCGLDRLEWSEVKDSLERIFSDTDISITVYNFQQGHGKHSDLRKGRDSSQESVSSGKTKSKHKKYSKKDKKSKKPKH